jgi:hypothetical protein
MSWNPAAVRLHRGRPAVGAIVGRRFDDLGVLRASAALEGATWADKRPSLG